MSDRDDYDPGPATGAEIQKDGATWTLVLVRDLRHPPERVWEALTDPAHLRDWAPFDADRNLGTAGVVATLSAAAAAAPVAAECRVKRADAPRRLEYSWGEQDLRWELEPQGGGTRLKLWHNIDRRFIAMGAAGWHICLAVLDRRLDDRPIGRIVGADAMRFGGWQRLHAEYAKRFGLGGEP